MDSAARKQTFVEVAKLYYISGKSQDQIAEELDMSRSNVSRILKKCVEEGIVEIVVHDNLTERPALSLKLSQQFQLKNVIIAPSCQTEEETLRCVGERLAMYLEQTLRDGMTLGVGRGRACRHAGERLKNPRNVHVNVLQLQGAVSPVVTDEEGSGLVALYVSRLNGQGYGLNAPLMVRSKRTRQELLGSEVTGAVVRQYGALNMAIFEIEKPTLYTREPYRQEWLTKADLLQLSEDGVACGICGHYYDSRGRRCNTGINDRVIAITPEALRRVPCKVGVVIGTKRLSAVLSALKGGFVDVLVTDENLAFRLLEQSGGKR